MNDAIEILKILESNNYKAYIVGGYVRDYILKNKSYDIDICTNALPKDVSNLFDTYSSSYGSTIIIYKNKKYEITTFRKEYVYDKRKPINISYVNDLNIDLERRDFTINTICMDSNLNIIDLYNGRLDLKNKIIKCVGDSFSKFKEDPLRILRAIRFATILNFKLDIDVINSIRENKHLLKEISFERKKEELSKIFTSKSYLYGIKLLTMLDLYNDLDIYNISNTKLPKDILGIWSILDINHKYPFTKIEKNTIININCLVNKGTISKYDIYKNGLYVSSIAADILGINRKVIVRMENKLPIKSIKDINITTNDIINLINKKPGKWISDIYKDLEIKIIDLKLKNNKDIIKEYILNNYM